MHIPYNIHPWIAKAIAAQKEPLYIPNPDRPRYLNFTNEAIEPLDQHFVRGDIVVITFRVGFIVGGLSWTSELIPVEFIRVGHIGDIMQESMGWPTDPSFVPLEVGKVHHPLRACESNPAQVDYNEV